MLFASFSNLVGPDLIVIALVLAVMAIPALIALAIVLLVLRKGKKPPPLPESTPRL
jgi:hypothetical protein